MPQFIKILFSQTGLIIVVYLLIGVFYNTAPPHVPTAFNSLAGLHSVIQYILSIMLWPANLWHPVFSVGKWTGH